MASPSLSLSLPSTGIVQLRRRPTFHVPQHPGPQHLHRPAALLQVLQRLSFADDGVRKTLLRQGRIMLFYYFLTFHILRSKRPKYQKLLPPKPVLGVSKASTPSSAALLEKVEVQVPEAAP